MAGVGIGMYFNTIVILGFLMFCCGVFQLPNAGTWKLQFVDGFQKIGQHKLMFVLLLLRTLAQCTLTLKHMIQRILATELQLLG
jgi:hypothetical protein